MVKRWVAGFLFIVLGVFFVTALDADAKTMSGASFVSYKLNARSSGTDLKTSSGENQTIATVFFTNVSLSPADLSGVATANIEPAIIGIPLNFPNPFRLSSGSQIGYELSKPLDLKIRIYNIFGREIQVIEIASDTEGGMGTPYYNKVDINRSTFLGKDLAPGVYFYVISYLDTILGKGKLAIKP